MNIAELKSLSFNNLTQSQENIIEPEDIYKLAASITMKQSLKIIHDSIQCKNIIELSDLCKQIITIGYPIDTILMQLNKAILESNKLNTIQKSKIIINSGDVLLKIKECGNEYIQLLNYLVCVWNISKNN
nr:replication factor C [Mimivirus sp.]